MRINNLLLLLIGLAAYFSLSIAGCEVEEENYTPTASFTVSPTSGTTETIFFFDASASADVEDATADLVVHWDFNNDGVWDTDWITEKGYSIQYLDEVTYTAVLEGKATQGLIGQTSQTIAVSNGGGGGSGTFTDSRDNQVYNTVTIGTQVWFAQNLNYQASGSLCYDDDPANCDIYGRLYNWQLAKVVCPVGWHLPGDAEWKQLEMQLGMSQPEADSEDCRGTDQGKQMKSTSGWANDGNGTNSSGFSALPGGSRNPQGFYHDKTGEGVWWTSSEYSSEGATVRLLSYEEDAACRFESFFKTAALSIRCVKD